MCVHVTVDQIEMIVVTTYIKNELGDAPTDFTDTAPLPASRLISIINGGATNARLTTSHAKPSFSQSKYCQTFSSQFNFCTRDCDIQNIKWSWVAFSCACTEATHSPLHSRRSLFSYGNCWFVPTFPPRKICQIEATGWRQLERFWYKPYCSAQCHNASSSLKSELMTTDVFVPQVLITLYVQEHVYYTVREIIATQHCRSEILF